MLHNTKLNTAAAKRTTDKYNNMVWSFDSILFIFLTAKIVLFCE